MPRFHLVLINIPAQWHVHKRSSTQLEEEKRVKKNIDLNDLNHNLVDFFSQRGKTPRNEVIALDH